MHVYVCTRDVDHEGSDIVEIAHSIDTCKAAAVEYEKPLRENKKAPQWETEPSGNIVWRVRGYIEYTIALMEVAP